MKTEKFNFGEKTIETPSLMIKQNIMTWENTLIQLSNISYISAANQATIPFPVGAVLLLFAGMCLLQASVFFSLLMMAGGGIWMYLWYQQNEKRKKGAILTIRMNSGHNLYFTFEEKSFLFKVLNVLERIIIDGGTSSPITINIKDNTITNSRILTNNKV